MIIWYLGGKNVWQENIQHAIIPLPPTWTTLSMLFMPNSDLPNPNMAAEIETWTSEDHIDHVYMPTGMLSYDWLIRYLL